MVRKKELMFGILDLLYLGCSQEDETRKGKKIFFL